jgi:integrase
VAHISKYGDKWRAEVCVERKRRAKTFKTKRDATAWANEQESDGILARHTLRDALTDYEAVARSHKGSQAELSRLKSLATMKCVDLPLEFITPAMIAAWRDARLKEVAPVSVRREMIVLGAMLKLAIREWGWLRSSPLDGVVKPPTSKPRRRGISQGEIDAICAELATMRVGPQVAQMFLLSIETGMRLSELLALRWPDVAEKYCILHDSKNKDSRQIPLSIKAREIVAQRRQIDPVSVFTLTPHVASKTFQRARTEAKCHGVHFHDARSEAITRLSKKLDVLQLAKMIGHRDIKSLMFYYAESAESMADRL